MPMTRTRAYVEVGKMAAYMAFPLVVYIFTNKRLMIEELVEGKFKKKDTISSRAAVKQIPLLDPQNSAMDFMMDLTKKMENIFKPKKD